MHILRFTSCIVHRPLCMHCILGRLCCSHHIGFAVSSDTTEGSGLPCMHACCLTAWSCLAGSEQKAVAAALHNSHPINIALNDR